MCGVKGPKAYAIKNEEIQRFYIPKAANQIKDLRSDPNTLARFRRTRIIQGSVLQTDPGKSGDNNVAGTAASAAHIGGGMCNEYSALSFLHHIKEGVPVVRYWGGGHSFTVFGDPRDPRSEGWLADGWTTDRDPVQLQNSSMARTYKSKTQSSDGARMPGDGQHSPVVRLYDQFIQKIKQYDENMSDVDRFSINLGTEQLGALQQSDIKKYDQGNPHL